ncbi:MAG: hypothetical protein BWY31_01760 [Lentisphaerae bacterium ADurb.Bin242]|nr:MAG: hypothetical protein BWY31_01760 [Lentisphaerae bacterium ADurb.Bin242]
MNACDVLAEMKIQEKAYAIIIPGWGQSVSNMPDKIDFLLPENIKCACDWSCLEKEVTEEILAVGKVVAETPALRAFAWHIYYKLMFLPFSYGNYSHSFGGWPLPEHHLGHAAGLFYVLVALGLVPHTVKKQQEMNIPDKIIRDTLNLTESIAFYKRSNGIPGIDPSVIHWHRLYVAGRLFTLGRFQYKLAELFSFGAMLRSKSDGRRLLFAEPGMRFNSKGFIVQSGCESDSDRISSFELTDTHVSGFPVSPEGFAFLEKHTCSRKEWDVILRRGDILLDLHIPSGGKMTPDACHESLELAFRFFREHRPGQFVPAVISRSWIFNTQFEEMLPDSNLAKLMCECYLFPCPSDGKDGFFFLFGKDYPDPKDAPHDTTLRRAMLSVLERGDRLRLGGMLFLAEDLQRYGKSVYRSQFKL